jgi:phospholipase/lecithinase/hemolysin
MAPGTIGLHCFLQARAAGMILKRRILEWLLVLVCLVAWTGAQASYSNLFVFGDSLSDTGNNAFVFDVVGAANTPPLPPGTLRTPVPTPDNSFIPTYPYATPVGGRYSNGPVWTETFAPAFGLSAAASNLGGTNYAYGGARVGPVGPLNPFQDFPNNFPLSLTTQVTTFLAQYPQAPADALYIVEGGGNDARDIIAAAGQDILNNIDPLPDILSGAAAYAGYVNGMVDQLEAAGAKDIIVWNTPNAGLAPAILAQNAGLLGETVSQVMNMLLMQELADEIAKGVRIFDTFDFVTNVTSNPGAYGLVDATNACSTVLTNCDEYFFWDGIHPTAAGHRLLANAMIAFVPEPTTIVLLALGLFGIAASRKRKSL